MGAKREISDALDRLRAQLATIPTAAAAIAMTEVNARHGIAMLAAEAMADHPDESFRFKDSLLPSSIDFALNGVGCGIDPCDDGRWSASFKRPDGRRHFAEFHTFAAAFEWVIEQVRT